MSFLDKLFGGKREDVDIEEFLNTLGEEEELEEEEEAQRYVKPMQLTSATDYDAVMAEINKGNIILLNIRPLSTKNTILLKDIVTKIRDSVLDAGGDIARISEFQIIITPPGIKIVRRRSR